MTLYDFVIPKLEATSGPRDLNTEMLSSAASGIGRCERGIRRAGDLTIAACAIAVLAPLMLAIAVAVRLSSPGPVFFKQRRAGLDRELFWFWKFRTMYVSADEAVLRDQVHREMLGEDTSTGGSWKLPEDDRITSVGRVLRRWSLDELPQLFNVLAGTMSLVGPRPCLEWEAELFAAEFGERFSVRPGLTGLWQVSGRSTMGTREMLALDVQYVRTRTLLADIGILARTLPAVLRVDGAR